MTTQTRKNVLNIYPAPAKHWVGDGFHVHNMFHYQEVQKNLDPFLLMDYAAPEYFAGNLQAQTRGVGAHPHRGFETVTIAYQGEVSHQDSAGGGGTIGTGDVQWMTAGSGVMHSEFHSQNFAKSGGMFEMLQLWVNLPAKDKMTTPKYQAIKSENIPSVSLGGQGGARIIAGEFQGTLGTASTFSPINMWDVHLNAGGSYRFEIPETHNLLILIQQGEVRINDEHSAGNAQLITFTKGGQFVDISATEASKLVILSGEPLNEPIVGRGPFVMNTEAQLAQAFKDFRDGAFGQLH